MTSPLQAGLSKQEASQGGFSGTPYLVSGHFQNPILPMLVSHLAIFGPPSRVGSNGRCFALAGASHLTFTPPTSLQWVPFTPGLHTCRPMERLLTQLPTATHRGNFGQWRPLTPPNPPHLPPKYLLTSYNLLNITS